MLEQMTTKSSSIMGEWLQYLAEIFYYTPERNSLNGDVITPQMAYRGDHQQFKY